MMIAMLVAGIGCLLAGLLAIGFGIPVNEFSFGNTLILSGAVATCTGFVILSLWAAVRELKKVAEGVGPGRFADANAAARQSTAAGPLPRPEMTESPGLFGRDAVGEPVGGAETAPSGVPWSEGVAGRQETPAELSAEAQPVPRPRRHLMFSSTSHKERARAQARTTESSEAGSAPSDARPASEVHEPPAFDDAWPKSERSRPTEAPPQRRAGRAPSTVGQPPDRPPAEDQAPVTVIKSGVVDGMAYSLYSDGSIEAQMPEGMMRFASIDELRAHLDHRS